MRLADVVALSDVPRDLRHESPDSSRLNPAKSGWSHPDGRHAPVRSPRSAAQSALAETREPGEASWIRLPGGHCEPLHCGRSRKPSKWPTGNWNSVNGTDW